MNHIHETDVHEATRMSSDQAGLTLLDPSAYADGRFERACTVLRHESPVHWVEAPDFAPFHALTKHKDVLRVERDSELFRAGPRYRLFRPADEPGPHTPRALVRMDPPEHTAYRNLVADRFRRPSVRRTEDTVRALAKAAIDRMAGYPDAFDFMTDIAMEYPLTVVCSMMGIPEQDRQLILRLTQTNFGAEDPDYRLAPEEATDARMGFAQYFLNVITDRRANPTDDLSSILSLAEIDGEPLPIQELIGFLGIVATAGHDTTAATLAGGLHALLQHPDQLEQLRQDMSLIPSAVDEMIRWTSPVNSFMRTATADTEIDGAPIAAGEAVMLLYPSANRDEDVFVEPGRFDVRRRPNHHLAFGQGVHYCLGTHLAKMELEVFFEELLPRLGDIELAGAPERVKTLFVGGLKHLPVRAEVK
jgi:cytochrome P450